ncbi:MAG: serine hydrolase domain-containing protein [Planctomycetota bacterium]
MKFRPILAHALLFLVVAPASAQDGLATKTVIPIATPEAVGMSASKLSNVDQAMKDFVADGKMVGGIVMIARRGKICFFESYGLADREGNQAMEKDTIVRIYSMTKAITTAAALMLVDEGKLRVDDAVSKYIPELSSLKIVSQEGETPAQRAMTVADLMRHTSGLTYGWSNDRLARVQNERGLLDRDKSLEEMAGKMADMPIRFEPSTGWEYGISTDVLGRVIEVVAEVPFETFLQARLLDPLEMRDTDFYVPPEKQSRLAACYSAGELKRLDEQDTLFLDEPAFKSGGGGLVSTASDYMKFLMMIERGGELFGKRYLKPETTRLMTSNQLPEGVGWIRFGQEVREGVGFSFGFSVREEMSNWDPDGKVGEYGWGGAASTHYWVSPKDELIVITIEQVMPYRWLTEFGVKKQIYDSIVD